MLIARLAPPCIRDNVHRHCSTLLRSVRGILSRKATGRQTLKVGVGGRTVHLKLRHSLGLSSVSNRPCATRRLRHLSTFARRVTGRGVLNTCCAVGRPCSSHSLLAAALTITTSPLTCRATHGSHSGNGVAARRLRSFACVTRRCLPTTEGELATLLRGPPGSATSMTPRLHPTLLCHRRLLTSPIGRRGTVIHTLDKKAMFPTPKNSPMLGPGILPAKHGVCDVGTRGAPGPET